MSSKFFSFQFKSKSLTQIYFKSTKHFEDFISSHKQCDSIIDVLLSTSLPILVGGKTVLIWVFFLNIYNWFNYKNGSNYIYCSTLYGNLCLISSINNLDDISSNYDQILALTANALYWLMNKSFDLKAAYETSLNESIKVDQDCLNKIIGKIMNIYQKHERLLVDSLIQLENIAKMSKFIITYETIKIDILFYKILLKVMICSN
jgi:hypothetical protein